MNGTMSNYKKNDIWMKALYLLCAYKEARLEMPFKTWTQCCRHAIVCMSNASINYISNAEAKFCNDGTWSFVWTTCFISNSKPSMICCRFSNLIPVLAVTSMKEYGRENLDDLSIDLMHSHPHDTVLRSIVAERLVQTDPADAIANWPVKESSILGDAPRIITDECRSP